MEKIEIDRLVEVPSPRRRPMIIAHRGASREAPENTLHAIRSAIERGADGVEIDVLLTLDRVPIVTHNDDLSVLTGHRGYAHLTPFATVRSLDVGIHHSAAFAGTTMPTLTEALDAMASEPVHAIVEIKPQPGLAASAAELIGGIVQDFRMKGGITISSSSIRILSELKQRHPGIPRALIVRQRAFALAACPALVRINKLSGIHASLSAVTPWLVGRMKRSGVQILAWTANSPDEFDHCIALEVDGIITDDVAGARGHVGRFFSGA